MNIVNNTDIAFKNKMLRQKHGDNYYADIVEIIKVVTRMRYVKDMNKY